MILLVLGKKDSQLTLRGITNDYLDLSVDSTLEMGSHILKMFNPDISISHRINSRQFREKEDQEDQNNREEE